MNEQEGYGFCPKCGALMQNGVCQSCNYGRWHTNIQERTSTDPTRRRKRTSGKKILIGVCIGLVVLLMAVIILFLYSSVHMAMEEAKKEVSPWYDEYGGGYFGYGNPYIDDGTYDDSYDDYYEGYYEPDEDDDYYREITDATSTDLSYGVIWQSISMRADDSDDTCSYDSVFPVLTGEGEQFTSVNAEIEKMVCEYKNSYQEYEEGVTSYGYVTYMDEEKISVVVKHSLYNKKSTMPIVRALTFYVKTGEVMKHTEMITVDTELVWQFRTRNSYQNGTVEFVDEISDEELQEYLKDEENSIMFYTPVGLEIGFNYDKGWVTVTLKNGAI